MLNRIAVDKLAMKNTPLGPTLSIELPPLGETSVGFPWRPVPEHLANLLGIRELLTAGGPTTVTDRATALSTWSNQPEKGTMVKSLPHD